MGNPATTQSSRFLVVERKGGEMGDKSRVVALLRITIAQLLVERDSMLEPLKKIASCDISPGGWGGPRALQIAKAAITKAEKGGE